MNYQQITGIGTDGILTTGADGKVAVDATNQLKKGFYLLEEHSLTGYDENSLYKGAFEIR